MFFSEAVIETKLDAARVNEDGARCFTWPSTTYSKANMINPRCAGCTHAATHNATVAIAGEIPDDETRYEGVSTTNLVTSEDVDRLQAALWALHYIPRGYIPPEELIGFGGDGLNNPTEQVRYRVVSVTGSTVRLHGPNPKKIAIGIRSVNPEWLPDSEEARVETATRYIALPLGAELQFLRPSSLAEKVRPMVIGIDYPASDDAEVDFDIEVWSDDLSNWDTPEDEDQDPENFECRILFEVASQAAWVNAQPFPDVVFSKRMQTFATAAVHNLKDFTNGDCRIVMPGMMPGAVSVVVHRTGGDEEHEIFTEVETVPTGSSAWATQIDLTAYDYMDLVDIDVHFWVQGYDAGAPLKVRFQGTCSNDQYDPAAGGRRCMNPNCSGFANFESGACWQPSADGFCLGSAVDGFMVEGRLNLAIGDFDSRWLDRIWAGMDYQIQQIAPQANPRALRLRRSAEHGGPSICDLAGSYTNLAPVLIGPWRFPYWGPSYGRRVTDDDLGHIFVAGALWSELWVEGDSTINAFNQASADSWTMGSVPLVVSVVESLSNFSDSTDPLGTAVPTRLRYVPTRLIAGYSVVDNELPPVARGHVTTERYTNADAIIPRDDMTVSGEPNDGVIA